MRLRSGARNRQDYAWTFVQLVFRPLLTRGAAHENILWQRDDFPRYPFDAQAIVKFELADHACTP